MHPTNVVHILALAASVTALAITFPNVRNSSLDLSVDNTITWTTIFTDPATVRIILINGFVSPPFTLTLTPSVDTENKKFTLKPQSNVKPGPGFKINFIDNQGQSTGILAQSIEFTIKKVAEKAIATSTESSSSGTIIPSSTSPAATSSGNGVNNVQTWISPGAFAAGVAILLL